MVTVFYDRKSPAVINFDLLADGDAAPFAQVTNTAGTVKVDIFGRTYELPPEKDLEHRTVFHFDYPFSVAVESLIDGRKIYYNKEEIGNYYTETVVVEKKLLKKRLMNFRVLNYQDRAYLTFHIGDGVKNTYIVKSEKSKRTVIKIDITEGDQFATIRMINDSFIEMAAFIFAIEVAMHLGIGKDGTTLDGPTKKYTSANQEIFAYDDDGDELI